jgi:hypothetical protein
MKDLEIWGDFVECGQTKSYNVGCWGKKKGALMFFFFFGIETRMINQPTSSSESATAYTLEKEKF